MTREVGPSYGAWNRGPDDSPRHPPRDARRKPELSRLTQAVKVRPPRPPASPGSSHVNVSCFEITFRAQDLKPTNLLSPSWLHPHSNWPREDSESGSVG